MINSGISLSTTNVCYTNCTFATNYVRSLLTPLSSQQEKSFLTSQKRKRERKSERAVEKTKQTCFCHLRKLMHDSWERVGTRKARGLQKADAAYLDSS
uniref:MIP20163p n=1 Tax=Drosophila melanogaster TaxID=7227 RepID=D5A7M0_DROME